MSITPEALREASFRTAAWKGYHPDDVDEFLERLAAGIEVLEERLAEATDRAAEAERRAVRRGQVESDKAMRQLLADSQAEADELLSSARAVAVAALDSAKAYAEALERETEVVVEHTAVLATREVEGDVRRLEAARHHTRAELLAFERSVVSDALPRRGPPAWPPCLHAVEQQLPGSAWTE